MANEQDPMQAMEYQARAVVESAATPAAQTAGHIAGLGIAREAVGGDETTTAIQRMLDPADDLSDLTVEGAAVRGETKVGAGATDLGSAESANKDRAAASLGLTREEFDKARTAGLLQASSGNPGMRSSLDPETRA